jgi:hypothetical protein
MIVSPILERNRNNATTAATDASSIEEASPSRLFDQNLTGSNFQTFLCLPREVVALFSVTEWRAG